MWIKIENKYFGIYKENFKSIFLNTWSKHIKMCAKVSSKIIRNEIVFILLLNNRKINIFILFLNKVN